MKPEKKEGCANQAKTLIQTKRLMEKQAAVLEEYDALATA